MKPSISAIVLTRNEENNIERCLASVSWCDEIIIVDDYSEDAMLDRIKNYESRIKNLRILKRRLNGDFASQRNFGLEKATGDWVLFIDADEVISEALAAEIKSQIFPPGSINGFYLKRQDWFLGRWLKFGETSNVKLLRLARKNAGFWQGRVHETWNIDGEIGEFKNPLLHYPHQTVAAFLKEINWYTDIVAQYWSEQGRRIKIWEILVYPVGKFLQNYILRLGILDGIAGLIMAFMMSFHSFLVRGKLWLSQHKNG